MKKITISTLLISSMLPFVTKADFSAELLLGSANQESSTSAHSTSGDDVSFGIRGSYSLNEYVFLEAAYQNYGESTEIQVINDSGDKVTDKLNSTALNVGVRGNWILDKNISLNARAGFSFWDAELEQTYSAYPNDKFKADNNDHEIYYGIGAQYEINSKFTVGIEYTIINMNIPIQKGPKYPVTADFDVKNLSLSLGYKF